MLLCEQMLAFAKLGHNPGQPFLEAFSKTTRNKLREFTPQVRSAGFVNGVFYNSQKICQVGLSSN